MSVGVDVPDVMPLEPAPAVALEQRRRLARGMLHEYEPGTLERRGT